MRSYRFLTPEDGMDRLTRNVGKKWSLLAANNPEECSSHLLRVHTDMRRLTTVILSEMRFRRCANVIECTYTNLDSIA